MSEIHGKESITQFLLLRVLLKTLKKPPPPPHHTQRRGRSDKLDFPTRKHLSAFCSSNFD